MRITNSAPSEKLQLESLHEVTPRTVGAEAQPTGKIPPQRMLASNLLVEAKLD